MAIAVLLLLSNTATAGGNTECPGNAPVEAAVSNLPVSEWRLFSQPTPSCITAAAFLARQRVQAAATTDVSPAGSAQGYVPKTKDDNTPWRFDMNQNGRRMTADEFDAWMKAKGIRVATGKPAGEVLVQPDACVPTTGTAC